MIRVDIFDKKALYYYCYFNDVLFKEYIDKRFKNIGKAINNFKQFQIGGSIDDLTIKYNNEKFIFENEDENIYVLRDINDEESVCVHLTIDSELKTANIYNLTSTGLKCGNTITTFQGRHLVNLTVKMLKKYKTKFNIDKIQLSEHSFLSCDGHSFNASKYLLLTIGETFYGKYGFIPSDKINLENEIENIKILKGLKLKDVNFNLIIKKAIKKDKNKFYEKIKNKSNYKDFIETVNKLENQQVNYLDVMRKIFTKDNMKNSKSVCYIYLLIEDELENYFIQFHNLNNIKTNFKRILKI